MLSENRMSDKGDAKPNKSDNTQPDVEADNVSQDVDGVECDEEEGNGGEEKEEGGSNEVAANNSNGRWARQEHQRFLEGLHKYGKEWKRVAAHVKTRTVVQTRTHAQKYFQKVSKSQERIRFVSDHLPHDLEMMEDKLSIPSSSLSGGMLAFPDFRHLPPGSLFFDSSGRIIRPADLNVNFQGQGQPQVIPLFMAPSEGMYNHAFKVSGGEAVPRSASTEEGATLLMTSLRTSANSSYPSRPGFCE